MARRPSPLSEILLVGGQIAAGKTTVATGVAQRSGAELVKVREALQTIVGGAGWDRRRLQVEGASLDRRTNGRWLLEFITERAESSGRIVVDAARTRRQTEPILTSMGNSRLVYLAASETTRRARFAIAQASDTVKRSMAFEDAMAHGTEVESVDLLAMAHWVIPTDDLSAGGTVDAVLDHLGWDD
jgi:hypothetical protein